MKKFYLLIVALIVSSSVQAQFQSNLKPQEGMLGGGFGMTWIDDQPHYSFHIFPELAFANIGVGLDLNLEFDGSGNLRKENFNEFSDYLSIIRYFRYGYKGDPFYIRVGALDYATLGNGSIMYLYNNSPSYDVRKVGVELDLDFSTFGFESVWGTFGEAGVMGLRGYVRPLQFTELRSVPIIGNIEVGATFAGDFNSRAAVDSIEFDAVEGKYRVAGDDGSVTAYGFDIGIPIIRASLLNLDVYFDYASISDYGSGTAVGIKSAFNGLGLVTLNAKLERRFNNDEYIPAYFNSLYEVERFQLNQQTGFYTSRYDQLKTAVSIGNVFYGELSVGVLGAFNILGSYQRLDEHPTSGILHLSTNVAPETAPYVARAGYDKINIRDEGDMFKLDDRSYLFAELGYKPMQYILVSMVYHWTFSPIRDSDDNVVDYEPQKKIEPRVSFIYPINF